MPGPIKETQNMASAKYQEIAREWLLAEVDGLAAWLEANVNHLRKEYGEDTVILTTRNSNLDTGDNLWTYGTLSFELAHGNEVL
jgi:hypothetical protein